MFGDVVYVLTEKRIVEDEASREVLITTLILQYPSTRVVLTTTLSQQQQKTCARTI